MRCSRAAPLRGRSPSIGRKFYKSWEKRKFCKAGEEILWVLWGNGRSKRNKFFKGPYFFGNAQTKTVTLLRRQLRPCPVYSPFTLRLRSILPLYRPPFFKLYPICGCSFLTTFDVYLNLFIQTLVLFQCIFNTIHNSFLFVFDSVLPCRLVSYRILPVKTWFEILNK